MNAPHFAIDLVAKTLAIDISIGSFEEFCTFCDAVNAARDVLWKAEAEADAAPPPKNKRRYSRMKGEPKDGTPSAALLAALRAGKSVEQAAKLAGVRFPLPARMMAGRYRKAGLLP